MPWRDFAEELVGTSKEAIKKLAEYAEDYRIYPRSINKKGKSFFFLAKVEQKKKLIILNESKYFAAFSGEIEEFAGFKAKIAPLNNENAEKLRKFFPYTAPKTLGNKNPSIGLGDRLGLATPGHIDAVKESEVMPVFAQQSVRELNLTNRSFKDVIDDVSWAVFQEGYEDGFAADADHLKNKTEVEKALKIGYTMITLDCTDYIKNFSQDITFQELKTEYEEIADYLKEGLESQYLNKTFVLGSNHELEYNKINFYKIVLTYYQVIEFAKEIYHLIKKEEKEIDFEISIDETFLPTSPEAHFFVANELKRNGIKINSLAPKFVGSFEKGIDYIGSLDKFEKHFKIHAEIAERFGHKLSIHSGSDKFSLYPIIGHYTKGRVHVKTAGTSWLEALRVVAKNNPSLFREIYYYALNKYKEAKEYYHVNTELADIPDLAKLSDKELPDLLENNEARQLLHITYGFILEAKKDNNYLFRDKLYQFWEKNDREYRKALEEHIIKHLKKLGFYN